MTAKKTPPDPKKYIKIMQFADDRENWLVETNDDYWIKRLMNVGATLIPPSNDERRIYVLPKQCFSIRKYRLVFTDEQRLRQAEHMRRVNAERLRNDAERRKYIDDA